MEHVETRMPHRSNIFVTVGFAFATKIVRPVGSVRSAPQCGQISVAWLISFSHSRQMYTVGPSGVARSAHMQTLRARPARGKGRN